MFPTTIWTTIRQAGANDRDALEQVAQSYRAPILRFITGKGFDPAEAEDLTQDVFVRLLASGVLERADAARGRFRSLLLSVAVHMVQDRWRKRRELPTDPEIEILDKDSGFDREWMVELVERALRRMQEEGSPYHPVLVGHLDGRKQNRNKLWIARKKLVAYLRHEVALTCSSPRELEDELEYLSQFLRPSQKN